MKSMVFKRLLLVMVLSFASNILASAQKSIDNLANKYEKDSKVEVTYTEERNPETKQIIRKNIVLKGEDTKKGKELWEAFEAERNNSVSVVKNKKSKFVISFLQKNYYSTYVLTISNIGSWTLVIAMSPASEYDSADFLFPNIENEIEVFGQPIASFSHSVSRTVVF